MKLLVALFSVLVFLKAYECAENLKNFKVYDVTPNAEQLNDLLLWRDESDVDFWRAGAAGTLSRVMVPPYLQSPFESFLKESKIDFKIHIEDAISVEQAFEADRVRRLAMKKAKSAIDPANFDPPNFDVYWTSDEMDAYSHHLANNYPNIVTREVITTTFGNRDVYALKISRGGFDGKPIIFMDCGMHAREWVSQASCMYLLYRMIEDENTSAEILNGVAWIIIPNLNPDGYHWAFTQNRMWRQNRNQINSTCVGVDLNRNWRYSWRTPNANTCGGQTYGGPTPLSELETAAENNYLLRYRPNVRMYISVHSWGDMVLYPWGYSGSPGLHHNWRYHHDVGQLWADAIQAATTKQYVVGNIADILGNAFGASDDHMSGEHGIDLVYTMELTGGGLTGFDFPEAQIGPLVRETFHGYEALSHYIARTYN